MALAFVPRASGHAVLHDKTAIAGRPFVATIDVMHGCKGAATSGLVVTYPAALQGVRPLAKPGWTITLGHDGPDTTVTWDAGHLPADQYDQFTARVHVSADLAVGTSLSLPVKQRCGDQEIGWTQPAGDERPAPTLTIAAKDSNDSSAIYKAGALSITRPWLRATLPGAQVAGGYLKVTNSGPESDRLISASIPQAHTGDVHQMVRDGDVMRMRPMSDGLEIKPGETLALQPGSLHLMFSDLTGALRKGEQVAGKVTFARAGTIDVTFVVEGSGAMSSSDNASATHDH